MAFYNDKLNVFEATLIPTEGENKGIEHRIGIFDTLASAQAYVEQNVARETFAWQGDFPHRKYAEDVCVKESTMFNILPSHYIKADIKIVRQRVWYMV